MFILSNLLHSVGPGFIVSWEGETFISGRLFLFLQNDHRKILRNDFTSEVQFGCFKS